MDMDLKTKIRQYIEAHTDEMVTDICDLCRIDSVRGEAAPGMPYGEGPHKALMAAADLCRKYGFEVKDPAKQLSKYFIPEKTYLL